VWCGFALAALAAGCATVTRGTTSQVQFVSDPPGAELRTSLGHACVTPCTLNFQRRDEFVVTFSRAGYRSVQIPVSTRIAGAGAAGFAGNVILGGVVGMGVDVATGAALEHCPNPVSVTLAAAAAPDRTPRRGVIPRPGAAPPPGPLVLPAPPECVVTAPEPAVARE
jgi:hypothetical protein